MSFATSHKGTLSAVDWRPREGRNNEGQKGKKWLRKEWVALPLDMFRDFAKFDDT